MSEQTPSIPEHSELKDLVSKAVCKIEYLSENEILFINTIKDYKLINLRKLSKAQRNYLRIIANK